MTLTVGTKHTPGRDIVAIAKDVRKDLKAAGLKCSVRVSRFSMGQSLSIEVKGVTLPETKSTLTKQALVMKDDCSPGTFLDCYEHCTRQLAESVADEYNRQDIDSMTDYYNVCFWTNARVAPQA